MDTLEGPQSRATSVRWVPLRTRISDLLIRFLLVIAALVCLWSARQAQMSVSEGYSATFQFPWGTWFWQIGLLILAGVLVGLAIQDFPPAGAYDWRKMLVIALPPALVLAHYIFVAGYVLPNQIMLPGPLDEQHSLMDPGPQFVLAFMVGISFPVGFSARTRPVASHADVPGSITSA